MHDQLVSVQRLGDVDLCRRWPDLMTRVNWLISAGVIPTEKWDRWDLVRGLRNETTHASIRHLSRRTKRWACSNS